MSGSRHNGRQLQSLKYAVGCCGRRGEYRQPARLLNRLYAGERWHLHARREHQGVAAGEVDLLPVLLEVLRVETADLQVVRDFQAQRILHHHPARLDVLSNELRERSHVRGNYGYPTCSEIFQCLKQRSSRRDHGSRRSLRLERLPDLVLRSVVVPGSLGHYRDKAS